MDDVIGGGSSVTTTSLSSYFRFRRAVCVALIVVWVRQLTSSTVAEVASTTMYTQGLVYVLNSGQTIQLDCEFWTVNFTHFHNPVVWRKFQRDEQTQMNVLGAILPPFVQTDRFNVTFTTVQMLQQQQQHPVRYRLRLSIANLSLEDSGNYTCEVQGRGSVVKATVTHYIFVRASVQNVYFRFGEVALPVSVPAAADDDDGDGDDGNDRRLLPVPPPPLMTFVEGQPTPVGCGSVGGYPPPDTVIRLDSSEDVTDRFRLSNIATLRGQKGLRLMVYETVRMCDDCVMTSLDDGRSLVCVVTVPGMKSVVAIATVVVHYAPIADCRMAAAQPGERNVHLDCKVKARPPLTALFWVIDVNGTTVSDGEVVSEYWTLVKDVGDGEVECQLYMRRAELSHFRWYTLIAENNIAVTTHRVPLVNKFHLTRRPAATSSTAHPVTRQLPALFDLSRSAPKTVRLHQQQKQQERIESSSSEELRGVGNTFKQMAPVSSGAASVRTAKTSMVGIAVRLTDAQQLCLKVDCLAALQAVAVTAIFLTFAFHR
jgi:hypothetical protein